MATPDPPQKKQGRPRKAPIASQKAPQKPNALRPSQPPDSDTQIKAPQELQANLQAENDDETDKAKSKKCWFTPESDGKSDIDLVAEWCSDFDNFNAWRTQQKNVVRERVSEYTRFHKWRNKLFSQRRDGPCEPQHRPILDGPGCQLSAHAI
ncbi:hypothetical protein DFH28DRAFT_607704 [Melampsora americana]|nr:hypothetical protein DFH28DRAFT_607704 [Melampsora americana]